MRIAQGEAGAQQAGGGRSGHSGTCGERSAERSLASRCSLASQCHAATLHRYLNASTLLVSSRDSTLRERLNRAKIGGRRKGASWRAALAPCQPSLPGAARPAAHEHPWPEAAPSRRGVSDSAVGDTVGEDPLRRR